jgi:hypothetical protein
MLGVEDSTGAKPRSWGGRAGESRMHFERQPWEMLKSNDAGSELPERQPRGNLKPNACSELALPDRLTSGVGGLDKGSTPLHSSTDSLTRRFDPTPALVCPPHSESCK